MLIWLAAATLTVASTPVVFLGQAVAVVYHFRYNKNDADCLLNIKTSWKCFRPKLFKIDE